MKKSDEYELLNFKIANNIRLQENEDLSNTNQIGQKTSNFFTETILAPSKNLNLRYQDSIKNNLSDINNEILTTELKFKNLISSITYLNENNTQNNNTYILNENKFKFKDNNQFMFSTRKNKKTDLTEFYKLIYQYENDCLAASIEYNKNYYSDRELKPEKSIYFKISLVTFGKKNNSNTVN